MLDGVRVFPIPDSFLLQCSNIISLEELNRKFEIISDDGTTLITEINENDLIKLLPLADKIKENNA